MPPTRVALCITDLDVGGAERCLQHLATGLDRDRFLAEVYCLGPRPTDVQASCVEPIEAAGIRVHCLGATGVRHFVRTVRQLGRLLNEQSPQVLQCFLFHANLVGRFAARRAHIPHVLSGIRVAERQSRWHLWLDRCTRHLVDRHVCVSHSVADFSVRHVGMPRQHAVVIPNGIDAEAAAAVEPIRLETLGIPSERRAITFVGRLEPQKGLKWLLETATKWLPELPDCDLLLVGRGSQQVELAEQSERLGLEYRVHFAGWRPDVLEILAASEMLVLPSRWEGMPNVVLQAMAIGLPVLATNVEGTLELFGEHATPQTTAYGDSQAFVEKLLAIMRHSQVAQRLGEGNRRRVAEGFTIAGMVAAYEELWSSLARHS